MHTLILIHVLILMATLVVLMVSVVGISAHEYTWWLHPCYSMLVCMLISMSILTPRIWHLMSTHPCIDTHWSMYWYTLLHTVLHGPLDGQYSTYSVHEYTWWLHPCYSMYILMLVLISYVTSHHVDINAPICRYPWWYACWCTHCWPLYSMGPLMVSTVGSVVSVCTDSYCMSVC